MSLEYLQRDVANGNRLLVDQWEGDMLHINSVCDDGVAVTPLNGGVGIFIDMPDGVPHRYDVVDAAAPEYRDYVQQAVKAGHADSFALPESVVREKTGG